MKSDLKSLTEASFAKRVLAVIIDGAFAIFTMFAFLAFMFLPIALSSFHYNEKQATRLHYQVASKLVICVDKDSDGNKIVYDLADLDKASDNAEYVVLTDYTDQSDEFYLNHVKYYYLNYKTGNGIECPSTANVEDYKAPNYKDSIDGKSPTEIYTEDWFNAKISSGASIKDIAYEAMDDLGSQDYYIENQNSIKKVQLFIILPPFFLGFSIFFIVIPLCFKNGETLGKKTLGLAFVTKDGYQIKKRQIVLRQLALLLYVSLITFVLGIGLTSIATLGIGVFIYFLATFISKTKRSPFDYLAYTYLIDAKKSVWFSNEFEESAKNSEVEENLSKLHKVEVDNKNVIQVGSTIVNEEIKREIELENKENKN